MTHGHDIEYNFKDPEHPLQLVFVCAMWLTGFDAPTLSTLYLDKPMQGHTLMQTIARANRVTSWKINGVEKRNGEIVDYYNVFRNMKQALKDYAQGGDETEPPVKEKAELFRLLDDAIEQGLAFCHEKAVALREVLGGDDVFEQARAGLMSLPTPCWRTTNGARVSTCTRTPSRRCMRRASRKCWGAARGARWRRFSICAA